MISCNPKLSLKVRSALLCELVTLFINLQVLSAHSLKNNIFPSQNSEFWNSISKKWFRLNQNMVFGVEFVASTYRVYLFSNYFPSCKRFLIDLSEAEEEVVAAYYTEYWSLNLFDLMYIENPRKITVFDIHR